jgi:AcrR family transcriptional regulator
MRQRTRLAHDERRRQLIGVAGKLITKRGVDRLQLTDVAKAAGVTRPVIYAHFPTRQALVMAVLEDFEAALRARFVECAMERAAKPTRQRQAAMTGTLEEITRVFIDAVCDTIELKGAGAWDLLASNGPDPAIAKVGHAIQERLVAPWRPRIAEMTGASKREVASVSRMLVAAGRAVLELWYRGSLTRGEAARHATRGVSALLREFTRS